MVFRKGQIVPINVLAIAKPKSPGTGPRSIACIGMECSSPRSPPTGRKPASSSSAVDSDSPAAQQGIRPGSIITSVAGKLVSNLEQLRQLVRLAPSEQSPLQSLQGTERTAASE